jgi:hypothetical protein
LGLYKVFFTQIQNNPWIRLHAGFLPKYFSELAADNIKQGLQQAKSRNYIAEDEKLNYSPPHLAMFKYILTGKPTT